MDEEIEEPCAECTDCNCRTEDFRIISTFEDAEEVGYQLTLVIQSVALESIESRQLFKLALSGGALISMLEEGLPIIQTDWSKWRFFFCDERVVPYEDADSTYGAYRRALQGKIPVRDEQFIKINPLLPAHEAADDYIQKLQQYFPNDALPQFDLLLLGMGPDGHTASLFPGHPACAEVNTWVTAVTDSPKPPPSRITLTYPVINNAATIIFLVTGENKAETVRRILRDGEPLPAALVRQETNQVIWMLDYASAALL